MKRKHLLSNLAQFEATHFVTIHLKSQNRTDSHTGYQSIKNMDSIDHQKTVESYLNSIAKFFTKPYQWKKLSDLERTKIAPAIYCLEHLNHTGVHVHIAIQKPKNVSHPYFEKQLKLIALRNPATRKMKRRGPRGNDVNHLDPNNLKVVLKTTYAPQSVSAAIPFDMRRTYISDEKSYLDYITKEGIENVIIYGVTF